MVPPVLHSSQLDTAAGPTSQSQFRFVKQIMRTDSFLGLEVRCCGCAVVQSAGGSRNRRHRRVTPSRAAVTLVQRISNSTELRNCTRAPYRPYRPGAAPPADGATPPSSNTNRQLNCDFLCKNNPDIAMGHTCNLGRPFSLNSDAAAGGECGKSQVRRKGLEGGQTR